MATAMQLVADHDVYYSSLICQGDYFVAGGVHRYGPYPGGVTVRLGPESVAGSEPGPRQAIDELQTTTPKSLAATV